MPTYLQYEIQDMVIGIKSIVYFYHIPLVKWIDKEPLSNQNEVRLEGPDLETKENNIITGYVTKRPGVTSTRASAPTSTCQPRHRYISTFIYYPSLISVQMRIILEEEFSLDQIICCQHWRFYGPNTAPSWIIGLSYPSSMWYLRVSGWKKKHIKSSYSNIPQRLVPFLKIFAVWMGRYGRGLIPTLFNKLKTVIFYANFMRHACTWKYIPQLIFCSRFPRLSVTTWTGNYVPRRGHTMIIYIHPWDNSYSILFFPWIFFCNKHRWTSYLALWEPHSFPVILTTRRSSKSIFVFAPRTQNKSNFG